MDNNTVHMLTTIDNPYNPFTQFDRWNQFDTFKGYNTLSYLGRVVDYDGCLTEKEKHLERESAIDRIVLSDPSGIYIKVTQDEEIKPIELDSKLINE